MKYTKTHEWVKINGDTATIGITNHAQEQLSDIVYVDFPDIGLKIVQGEEFMTVESVKAASSILAPLSGEVIEINSILDDSPEIINQSAEKEGWLLKIKISNASEYETLLDIDEYSKLNHQGSGS